MSKLGLKGYFDIVKRKADGQVVEKYSFENLILDSGLNAIGKDQENGFGVLKNCHVGSGNSQPNVSQTSLDSWLGVGSAVYASAKWSLNTEEKSVSYTYKATLNAGVATGNIAEIGMSLSANRDTSLFSRTLIKDNDGQPTVISKLNDEILEIYYTLKIIINHQDVTGIGKINDMDYRFKLRPAYLGSRSSDWEFYRGEISSDITSFPSGRITYTYGTSSHQDGEHKKRFSCTLSPNSGNDENGIRSVFFPSLFDICWQCQFERVSDGKAIMKTNKEKLVVNFDVSWGRA